MKERSNRPIKVLMVLYYYHPYVSGVSVYAKRLAESLVKVGYEVTVLTSRFEKSLPKTETISGVQVVRRPVMFKLSKGVIMPFFWWDIVRYARRYDYVNPHLPMADSGLAALFIPKKKMITSYQCDIFLGPGLAARLIEIVSMGLMKLQLARSRAIVTLSRDYFEHSKMKKFLTKARAVYPPITVSEFKPVDPVPLFKRLATSSHTVKIGFVGRIVYEKGINYLLDAIPKLSQELDDFKIIIAGDYEKVAGGSIKKQLDDYQQRYPNNLVFTGYLSDEDLKRFYSGLDVLVLPSIDPLEAFGMVQVEAMLCGVPVVASNLPGVRVVVKETGFGLISRIKDSNDIAKQIIEVVKHPHKYHPDRQRVAALFNPQETVQAYMELMP